MLPFRKKNEKGYGVWVETNEWIYLYAFEIGSLQRRVIVTNKYWYPDFEIIYTNESKSMSNEWLQQAFRSNLSNSLQKKKHSHFDFLDYYADN